MKDNNKNDNIKSNSLMKESNNKKNNIFIKNPNLKYKMDIITSLKS